jgi:hypothetical protein
VKFSNEDPMCIFFKVFYNYFSKFLHVRNQEIEQNMPKNYGINIFDYEGPRSLTHTVEVESDNAKKILISLYLCFMQGKLTCLEISKIKLDFTL